jgi:hypothetical protein
LFLRTVCQTLFKRKNNRKWFSVFVLENSF